MSKSTYCIKDNRLIIIDCELDISINIEFNLSKDINSEKIDEIKEYYLSKNLKAQRFYFKGKLHGPSTYFYENNQIVSKVWYVNGKKQGKSFQYYRSSKIYALEKYKDNLRHGSQKFFYEDGILKSELYYVKNQLDRKMILFWENGNIKRETSFSLGKRHGFDKIFSKEKKLLFVGEYKNNLPVGCHKSYDENGVIREKVIYKNKSYEKLTYNNFGNLIYV